MKINDFIIAEATKSAKEIILNQVVTGDVLKVKADIFPLISHYGVIIRNNEEFSVYHNDPFTLNDIGGSIIKEDALKWIKNKEIVSIISTKLSESEIKNKIKLLSNRKYHFLNNNCEHFIAQLKNQNYFSPQVVGFSILFSSLFLTYLILKTNKKP